MDRVRDKISIAQTQIDQFVALRAQCQSHPANP